MTKMIRYTGLLALCWLESSLAQEVKLPAAIELKSGPLELTLEPPDGRNGWYRGTRFDWSGMTSRIKFGTHELAARWQGGPRKATANDDVWGLAEEFDNGGPADYESCKPGETFVKIGVGKLRRRDTNPYHFFTPYEIVEPGEWVTKQADNQVTFEQSADHVPAQSGRRPVKYRYAKTVSLHEERAGREQQIVIKHSLTNRAVEPLTFTHYNHNFLLVDGDGVGPNYQLKLAFPINVPAPRERFTELAKLDGSTLGFNERLRTGSMFGELQGHKSQTSDFRFELTHKPSKLKIVCAGDQPLFKFNFWCVEKTICPEPYVKLTVEPGKTIDWTIRYTISEG
jgi:hypothetical protein